MSQEITFEIREHIGTLSINKSSGWSKEANIVAWNGNEPRLDIREWSPNHDRMSRGLTLSMDEGKKLSELLANR